MSSPLTASARPLDPQFTFILSFICAITIGNLYIVQPLLAEMATEFGTSPSSIGTVATLAQVGYGIGVLLVVPLGDLVERRALMLWLLSGVTASLLLAGFAPHLSVLACASLFIGFSTVVPQVILPYAASLAPDRERASVLGTIQSGLLIGILLARTVAGTIGEFTGWRSVYFVAAGMSVLIAIGIRARFPRQEVGARMSYARVLASMGTLMRRHSTLRRVSLSGAMNFAVFSSFWTVLSFLLKDSFGYGPAVVGLFGLVGVIGALAASVAGKLSDRRGTNYTQRLSLIVTLASFVLYLFAGHSIVLLVVGVLVMDAGVQANHVSCQAEVFSLDATARSRLNGLYMFSRFTGGALGSLLGAWAWSHWGWAGVCGTSIALCILAFIPIVIPVRVPVTREGGF